MNLKINRLQHIGIPVTDIEISQAFYKRLGFANIMQSAFMHMGAEGTVKMMQLDDIIIELYQMPEPELSNVKQRTNGHIDHVAFDVDSIDDTFATLKKAGFTIPEAAPVFLPFWKNGCKYFYILGPDGERLEFCQVL
jgi:catechol 2,3-dioxygenase-like lactoylglutathione lyase family enzyme